MESKSVLKRKAIQKGEPMPIDITEAHVLRKQLERLLCVVNAVTCQHRHGLEPRDKDLTRLSNRQIEVEEALSTIETCSDSRLILQEPDCSASDCQYNSKDKCKARPFITVGSDGKCLDYDVLTDEDIAAMGG